MSNGVSVDLDPENNRFVVKIDSRTIRLPPAQFESLIEAALGAAATHQNHRVSEGAVLVKKDEAIDVLTTTKMEASADFGAEHIVTTMHLGVIKLNFACERQAALDYCGQVHRVIQEAASGESPSMM